VYVTGALPTVVAFGTIWTVPPTPRPAFVGETERPVRLFGTATTVSESEADLVGSTVDVAVMTAVPWATAVMTPVV
jgi:hypothetical protein